MRHRAGPPRPKRVSCRSRQSSSLENPPFQVILTEAAQANNAVARNSLAADLDVEMASRSEQNWLGASRRGLPRHTHGSLSLSLSLSLCGSAPKDDLSAAREVL